MALRMGDGVMLRRLLRETKKMESITRPMNPRDLAWKHYDGDERKLEEVLTRTHLAHGVQEKLIRLSEKNPSSLALGQLWNMLDMLEGALERTRSPAHEAMQAFSDAMYYAPDMMSSRQARAVFADLLEERGYVGEANAIRAERASLDVKVLASLGIRFPPRIQSAYVYPERRPRTARTR